MKVKSSDNDSMENGCLQQFGVAIRTTSTEDVEKALMNDKHENSVDILKVASEEQMSLSTAAKVSNGNDDDWRVR